MTATATADVLSKQLRPELPGQQFDLTGLAQSIARHLVAIAICTLVGVAAGLGAFLVAAPSYTASQQLVVQGVISQPLSVQLGAAASDTSSLVNTQVSIIKGVGVSAAASRALGRPAPPVEVLTAASDLTMTISVSDGSPSASREAVNAYTSAYLQVLQSQGKDQLRRSVNILNKQISDIQQNLRATSNSNLVTGLNARLAQEQTALDQLEVQLANGTTIVQRLGPANVGLRPSGLSAASTAEIGGAAGLVLGIILAAFLELRTRRRPFGVTRAS